MEKNFLFGYDVEMQGDWEVTKNFLKVIPPIHKDLDFPVTFFVCGKTLENNQKEFKRVQDKFGDIVDFQQHTYSHLLFKQLQEDFGSPIVSKATKKIIFPQHWQGPKPGTKKELSEEIKKTSHLLQKILNISCQGLTTPYGMEKGLKGRKDLLQIIHNAGIKFVRSWNGSETHWDPINATPLEIQPFFYQEEGFPEIMEFPIHLVDNVLRGYWGWGNHQGYFKFFQKKLDKIKEGKIFSYAQHDHSTLEGDPSGSLTRKILGYALKKGFQPIFYKDYYFMIKKD